MFPRRNRKYVLCVSTRKIYGYTRLSVCVPTACLVPPNFHLCFYNSRETRSLCSQRLIRYTLIAHRRPFRLSAVFSVFSNAITKTLYKRSSFSLVFLLHDVFISVLLLRGAHLLSEIVSMINEKRKTILGCFPFGKKFRKYDVVQKFPEKVSEKSILPGAIIGDGDRKRAPFLVLRLSLWYGTIILFLEQIAPSPAAHARTCCEDFCGCRAGEMASEIPEIFHVFGPQLGAFTSVGILLKYFRRKLLQWVRQCRI